MAEGLHAFVRRHVLAGLAQRLDVVSLCCLCRPALCETHHTQRLISEQSLAQVLQLPPGHALGCISLLGPCFLRVLRASACAVPAEGVAAYVSAWPCWSSWHISSPSVFPRGRLPAVLPCLITPGNGRRSNTALYPERSPSNWTTKRGRLKPASRLSQAAAEAGVADDC